ncbi:MULTISPECIES: molybdenum cofactor guanylyltransferase MobA [Vibrio]|uniref:Molybdenum cofactor guanylyltransferase n=1 Tax=Vibrio casei TaxID=673372 RepID=A0A368LP58_9VIBR|nr:MULTISPECIES: molybdenum cofactor guanylyltransferase MobA [Vibrio]RCS73273.1 molybdenum cofactor guanylyltransferase MobA [Vibrio casei]SJN18376.1 Molybdopterin-guanine dinucleotide biosynthesis protein MobA [Vibrio casei]HBV75739.1 molybdenum cofactor guanylyltransferase MobA [Vibrio sp.]
MLTPEKIDWVVLAGGQGSRMGGVDKGLIKLNGKPFIEHVIEALKTQTSSIIINANRSHEEYQVYAPVISDHFANYQGPLGGIHAGLSSPGDNDWVGFVPCDSPNIPTNLAETFCLSWKSDADILVAHDGDFYQPVFALFHRSVKDKLTMFLERGDRKAMLFYAECQAYKVDFSHAKETFINLNTPEQLKSYLT